MEAGKAPTNGRQTATVQRERLLRTAAQLFAQQGYHATGVAELGSALSLGRGALYHHMGSKDALLAEIVARHVHEMVAFGEQVLEQDVPAPEKFRALSRRLMRTIGEDLAEVVVFYRESSHLQGEARAEVLRLRRRYEEIWAEVLEQGVRDGCFRADGPLVIRAILGMHNYSAFWIDPAGPMAPEEIADAFCDLLLRGLMIRDA